MTVHLVWATPNADAEIAYCARVSNPANQDNPDIAKLLRYCASHDHWSVFEMASACIEITTTRDIARQILRHRSFSFQEFSQRYASAEDLPDPVIRECRTQDTKNRQSSHVTSDRDMIEWFEDAQREVLAVTRDFYTAALSMGIAKEQARAILPEGLTTSRLYMAGTLRSWITYLQVRLDAGTQKEHREIAKQVLSALEQVAPVTVGAFFQQSVAR